MRPARDNLVLPTIRCRVSKHVTMFTGTIFAFFILNLNTLATADDGFVRYPPLPKKENSKVETPSSKGVSSDDLNAELESKGYVFFPPREKTQSKPQPTNRSEQKPAETRTETRSDVTVEKPKTDTDTIEPAKSADKLVITPNVSSVPVDSTRGSVGTNSSTEVSPARVSPTIEFRFDEKTKAQFSENHGAIQYRDNASDTSAGIQISRDSLGNTYLTARAGVILNEHFAVGTHFSTSERRHDINLSAAILMNSNRIQIRSSVGIMRGTQGTNFESGYADVDLQQVSKLLSLNYLPTLSDSQILELVGINFWDSRATQLSNLDGIYLTRETPTSYDTYYDPRRLSEGSINGISGKIKLRVHDRLRIEQSLGRERLYFPFSDGTYEESYKLYSNTVMRANIGDKSLLTLGVSSGAYERKARVDLSFDRLVFSFLNSQGLAGQKDYWSAGVQYNLLPFKNSGIGVRNTNSPNLNLTSSSSLLEVLSSRPVEFPHTFTVKTDPTSVRLISSITKGTITWQSSGILGTFFDSAAPSRQSISIQLQSTNSSGYAVDYDTTLVSGALPPGLTLSATGLISGTAAAVTSDTTYTFQVKAKSSGASDVTSSALSIIIKAPNSITWTSSGSLGDFNDSASPSRTNIQIQLSAISTTGAAVTYATTVASGSLPPGLSISSAGVISGTATAVAADTTYTFTVNAFSSDAPTQLSPSLSITIRKPQNISWTSSGSLGTFYDSATPSRTGISIQLQASSSNGGVVSFDTTLASGSLPPGMTLSSTGLISGTASAVIVDTTYTFQVVATSPNVPSSTSTALSITIKAPNSITWASSGSLGTFNDTTAPSRSSISIQLSASSLSGSSITYGTTLVSGTLPPGLSISSTGLISGTAAAVATDTTYSFTVSASSFDAPSVTSSSLSITIKAPDTVTWISSGSIASLNDAFTPSRTGANIALSATSASGESITYNTTLISGSLPPGLSLSSSGVISGTATAVSSDTTYTFKVSASTPNSGATSSGDLSITIKAPVLVKFTTSGVTILSGSPTTTSNSITFPVGLSTAKIALVGGGGGGGNGDGGGGGGAGALLVNTSFSISGQLTYSINVGRGGYGGGAVGTCGAGEDGTSTTFGGIVALGGGGGGCSNPDFAGRSGGSGGGASQNFAGGSASASCGSVVSGFSYFCNSGGTGNQGSTYRGGGGGGAGSAGTDGTDVTPGNGGAGYQLPSELGGGNVAGGGGGGNGVAGKTVASGGSSVGGNAGSGNGSDGIADTGSGGGGGGVSISDLGGNGSGGFVIIGY